MLAAATVQAPPVWSSVTTTRHQQPNVMEYAVRLIRNSTAFEPRYTTASFPSRRFVAAAASKSPNEEANSNADDSSSPFTSQDDLNYLLKLGAGSIAGAAAIKYGSILVPEITRPNITQALIMIFTPVLVSVLILIKESSVKR